MRIPWTRRGFFFAQTIIAFILAFLFGARVAVAQTTEDFMNRLVVCAGGIDLSIDAKLLGSVRSLYEGDLTNGTAIMKTEAAFLEKIPEKDRLSALALYHKCIAEIMSNSYAITEETLNFRIWLTIPTDMRIDLDNANVNTSALLTPDNFFAGLLYAMNINYRIARQRCEWHGLSKFNADYNYYFAHGHFGELYPDNISVSKKLWAQHWVGGKFAFGGRDWPGDKLNSRVVPTPSDQLKSVDRLLGKCLYIEFIRLATLNGSGNEGAAVGNELKKYGSATFKTLDLTSFSIKFSSIVSIEMNTSNSKKLYQDDSIAIWQVQLPADINDLRSH